MNESRLTPDQEERLAHYRAGRMMPDERATFEREVLASDALSDELFAEVVLDEVGLAPARSPAAPPAPLPLRPRVDWRMRIALPAAAAVLAVSAVALWLQRPASRVPDDNLLRGQASAPLLIEPSGELEEAPVLLRWNSLPSAARYRVDLYDLDGSRLGTVVTPDTVVAIEALTKTPVVAGEWRVVPIDVQGLDGPVLGRATFRVKSAALRP